MLIATIVTEVMFWVCLVLGSIFRYTLKMPKLGITLLAATPLIDMMLLAFSFITLRQTSTAEFMHGFAAFYIAFSIVFGRSIIQTFDRKFSGATPAVLAANSAQQLKKCVVACLIAVVLLVAEMLVTGIRGSFWLVYWVIAVIFTPLMWWGVEKWYAHVREKNYE